MSGQSYFFNPRDDRMSTAGAGFQYPKLDTTSRLGLSVSIQDAGMIVYDSTLRQMFLWDGTAWKRLARYDEGIVQADRFVVELAAIETNPQAAQADRFVVEFAAVEITDLGAQADRFVVEFAAVETTIDGAQADRFVVELAAVETTDLGAQLDKLTVTMIAMEL